MSQRAVWELSSQAAYLGGSLALAGAKQMYRSARKASRPVKKRTWSQYFRGSKQAMVPAYRPRVFKPIGEETVHKYKSTVVFQVPVGAGTTGITGFQLPGTTASTANPGLKWTFTPGGAYVSNANAGSSQISINNLTSYSNLYEQCELIGVEMRVFFTGNTAPQNTSSTVNVLPQLQYVYNDDAGAPAPTSVSTIPDYPDYKICQLGTSAIGRADGASASYYFKPKLAVTSAAGSAAVIESKSKWLSVENGGTTQQHYGLLMYLDMDNLLGTGTAYNVGVVSFYVTLYHHWKGMK